MKISKDIIAAAAKGECEAKAAATLRQPHSSPFVNEVLGESQFFWTAQAFLILPNFDAAPEVLAAMKTALELDECQKDIYSLVGRMSTTTFPGPPPPTSKRGKKGKTVNSDARDSFAFDTDKTHDEIFQLDRKFLTDENLLQLAAEYASSEIVQLANSYGTGRKVTRERINARLNDAYMAYAQKHGKTKDAVKKEIARLRTENGVDHRVNQGRAHNVRKGKAARPEVVVQVNAKAASLLAKISDAGAIKNRAGDSEGVTLPESNTAPSDNIPAGATTSSANAFAADTFNRAHDTAKMAANQYALSLRKKRKADEAADANFVSSSKKPPLSRAPADSNIKAAGFTKDNAVAASSGDESDLSELDDIERKLTTEGGRRFASYSELANSDAESALSDLEEIENRLNKPDLPGLSDDNINVATKGVENEADDILPVMQGGGALDILLPKKKSRTSNISLADYDDFLRLAQYHSHAELVVMAREDYPGRTFTPRAVDKMIDEALETTAELSGRSYIDTSEAFDKAQTANGVKPTHYGHKATPRQKAVMAAWQSHYYSPALGLQTDPPEDKDAEDTSSGRQTANSKRAGIS